jgi:hypothetical protein
MLDIVSLGVKRQEREADHSPPSTVEVKYGVHSPIYIHEIVLNCIIKCKAKLYVYLLQLAGKFSNLAFDLRSIFENFIWFTEL